MWKKLGRVYEPIGKGWRKTHGFTPTPYVMEDRVRVYTGFMGEDGKFRIGYVDIEKDNPLKIIGISENPIIELGEPGFFDSDGMIPSFIIRTENEMVLLYTGWQFIQGKLKRLAFSSSLISKDNGETFIRYSRVPILDRTHYEPYIRTMPICVGTHCFYIGAESCHNLNGWCVPAYNIKCYNFEEKTAIKTVLEIPDGYLGIGRMVIVKGLDGLFHMWMSLRSFDVGYKKIGHAVCDTIDGNYILDDNAILEPSESGWDSEMVCFPAIYTIDDNIYMLYCGNNYGETGFGIAKFIGD